MIEISALYLLLAFVAVFIVFYIVMFAHLYHGYRFGKHDPLAMSVNTGFVIATAVIIACTVLLLWPVDWSSKFTIEPPGGIGLQTPGIDYNSPDNSEL